MLVNYAGMDYTCSVMDTFLSNWQQVLYLNLTRVFEWVRAALPTMRDLCQGRIVKVSSDARKRDLSRWRDRCVSQLGRVALTPTQAEEKQSNSIRVTEICPNAVKTSMWNTEKIRAGIDRTQMLTSKIVAQSIFQISQLPVSATIEELTFVSNPGVL
ncbi:MAG: SDR family NAD(P)-dependent oxidoreductase [Geitlerinemataceae cyanobacterium]